MLFCTLSVGGVACSQEGNIKELRGRVHSTEKDVVGIVVQNVTSTRVVITDMDGIFSIPVKLSDTLVFSAVQFKRKILIINETFLNTSFLSIPLEEFINELDEVVVRPYNLTGDLNQDLDNLQLEKDVSAEAIGLPNANVRIISQSENKLNDADHGKFVYFYGVGFAMNVNKVLNRLSGRTKMLKKRVELDKKYDIVKSVEEKYIDSLFMTYLKIPQKQYYDFMYYCSIDSIFPELIKQENELKCWEFLIKKSIEYRENNNLD